MKRFGALLALVLVFLPAIPNRYPSPDVPTSRLELHGLQAYYGDLHCHSGFSLDGPCALPGEVYGSARQRGNDFLALTEHDYDLGDPAVACGKEPVPDKWGALGQAADAANDDGAFVALRGFEWTHSPNHINVINSNAAGAPYTADAFFDWLVVQPDKASIIAQFNHPLVSDAAAFPFRADVAPLFRTIETNAFSEAYSSFLRQGWKVGAVGYGDSHDIRTSGSRTYGVWAEDLTREAILSAVQNHRTFSRQEPEPNVFPTITTAFLANGAWMGETINADRFEFELFAEDPARTITRIQLLGGNPFTGGDGYHVLKEFPVNGFRAELLYSFQPEDPSYYRFYYMRVYARNAGGQEYLSSLSAPIFVAYDPTVPTPTVVAGTATPSRTRLPTRIPTATGTPTPTPMPPTATPTPSSPQDCTHLGEPILDQQRTGVSASTPLLATWGYGDPLTFTVKSLSGPARVSRVDLVASGNGRLQAKVMDSQGRDLTNIATWDVNAGAGAWVTLDFDTGRIANWVAPGETYTITFRALWGAVSLYHGSSWSWAYRLYLRPCVSPLELPTSTASATPEGTATLTGTPSPTVEAGPTATPSPTATPTATGLATPTATPSAGACATVGEPFLDRSSGDVYVAQALTSKWGVGDPLQFDPSQAGRVDRVALYLSWTMGSRVRVKITDPAGVSLTEEKAMTLYGSDTGAWVVFDFSTEPQVVPGEAYIITFREDYGDVYAHRGSYWRWAFEEWLRPCLY